VYAMGGAVAVAVRPGLGCTRIPAVRFGTGTTG
jgi:hypothetical protein